MKIIIDAKWIIDKEIFSEMLVITGYMELINKFKIVEKALTKQKTKMKIDIGDS
jgi:hypothetical protein